MRATIDALGVLRKTFCDKLKRHVSVRTSRPHPIP
jgi:hypothetical protein